MSYACSYCYFASLTFLAWTLFLTMRLTYFATNIQKSIFRHHDDLCFLSIFITCDEQSFHQSNEVWFILKNATQICSLFNICIIQILMFKPRAMNFQKQSPRRVPTKRCSENMQQIYRRAPMPRCDFNKVAKHWNHTAAWLFSCKFSAHFQSTFFLRTPLGGYLWIFQSKLKLILISQDLQISF